MTPAIEYAPRPSAPAGARFTILVPTWNNLALVKLCLASIERNSTFPHQVVLHVNDGSDGTLAWARARGLDHTASRENAGICHAMNAAATLARTPYLVFMNDDMYACPGWDAALWRAIEEVGHPRFLLSGTMIEPRAGNAAACAPHDFGRGVEDFREEELLAACAALRRDDWSGASWPPSLVHRDTWNLVGGYSTELSPGFYSDPDFAMKLWLAGVRIFRGVGESRVYHFQQKSTLRVVRNPGRRQFAAKYGVTASWFYRRVLRMGEPYQGPLPEPRRDLSYRLSQLDAWRMGAWPWSRRLAPAGFF